MGGVLDDRLHQMPHFAWTQPFSEIPPLLLELGCSPAFTCVAAEALHQVETRGARSYKESVHWVCTQGTFTG